MSRKKLDSDVVKTAISEALEKVSEDEMIDAAITKRLRFKGKPETREDTKKFYDYLMRQGFEYDLIRDKLSALTRLDDE